jgi:predicted acyltransferase
MSKRLISLDWLRGADMVLLMLIGPIVRGVHKTWHLPAGVMRQFTHEWGSLYLWDLIMPLFIFVCGAAVPLALTKRLGPDGKPGLAYWKHVLGRVAMLWFFGLIVQGNLLQFDLKTLYPYSNTLQAIAAGYFIAALAAPIRSRKIRFALPFVLAAVYSLPLAWCGDYSMEGNFAHRVEMDVLRAVLPCGSKVLERGTWGYTWCWTTLMFGAMTLAGAAATEVLLDQRWSARRRAATLALAGAGCIALGGVLVPVVPAIKHIYTASFTALATGCSMMLYAGLYYAYDVCAFRRCMSLPMLFGRCALAVYMINSVFYGLLDAAGETVALKTGRIVSGDLPFYRSLIHAALLVLVVYAWNRFKSNRGNLNDS